MLSLSKAFARLNQNKSEARNRQKRSKRQLALRPFLENLPALVVLDGTIPASVYIALPTPPPAPPDPNAQALAMATLPTDPGAPGTATNPTALQVAQQMAAALGGQLSPATGATPASGEPAPGPNWPANYNVPAGVMPAAPAPPAQPPTYPMPANPNVTSYGYTTDDENGITTPITVSYSIDGATSPTITVYGPPSTPGPITGLVTVIGDTYDANGNFIGTTTMYFMSGPDPQAPAIGSTMVYSIQTTLEQTAPVQGVSATMMTTTVSALQFNGTYGLATYGQLVVPDVNGNPVVTPPITPPMGAYFDPSGNPVPAPPIPELPNSYPSEPQDPEVA